MKSFGVKCVPISEARISVRLLLNLSLATIAVFKIFFVSTMTLTSPASEMSKCSIAWTLFQIVKMSDFDSEIKAIGKCQQPDWVSDTGQSITAL